MALLKDFSFVQAKLELGEGAALVEDYDRVLRQHQLVWVEEPEATFFKVGTPQYFGCKGKVAKVMHEQCVGFHAEAFQQFVGSDYSSPDSIHGDVVAFRHLIWRNPRALHKRPHTILQFAINAPGRAVQA